MLYANQILAKELWESNSRQAYLVIVTRKIWDHSKDFNDQWITTLIIFTSYVCVKVVKTCTSEMCIEWILGQ